MATKERELSTRVHEMAKELNVRSQEILDFLRNEGEAVKTSPLASLESNQIEMVRKQFGGSAESAAPEPAKAVSDIKSTEPAPRVISTPPVAKPVTEVSTKAPEVVPITSPPAVKPAAPPKPVEPVTVQPAATGLTGPPAASRPAEFQRPPMQSAPAGPRPPLQRPPAQGPRPGGGGPSGVQSGKTPVLSTGLHRPSQPPLQQRPPMAAAAPKAATEPQTQEKVEQPAAPAAPPAPPEPPSPFTRRDYIDPSGVRRTMPAPGVPQAPQKPPERKPPTDDSQERRQMPRPTGPTPPTFRSFAPTGAPTGQGPLHRSSEQKGGGQRPPQGQGQSQGPRPGSGSPPPQAGGGSYTRPDKKFTPDQLKAMMQSGQIGGLPGAAKPAQQPSGGRMSGSAPRMGMGAPAAAPSQSVQNPSGNASASQAPAIPIDDEEERKKAKSGTLGDRAVRRVMREKRQKDRVTSPVSVDAVLVAVDEEDSRQYRRRHKVKVPVGNQQQRKDHAEIDAPITVRSLSEAIGVKANQIMTLLFSQGIAVRINDSLPEQTALELALEFGVDLTIVHERTAEDDLLDAFVDETVEGDKRPRAPIITILGHVDHGKTSLLDKIRKSDVAAHESGGITQHIGAYQVVHNGHAITFLDTPGHEAFTSMRARGANVTDIVVLVVAADDGVMPQTLEAISHAKAADVPIIVALNKVDLPNINFNRIFGELSQHGLVPEEYGGDTLVVKTSAHTGAGIPELLENLLLIAELKEFKGNVNRPAVGTCLESQISEGRGVVATMLIQDGTLKIGDVIVCGDGYGRVRAMFNHRGEPVEEAGPSMPVEVNGLDSVPEAGEKFAVLPDLSKAREISETRKTRSREQDRSERSSVTLENLFDRMNEQRVRSLNIILKADVQGSLEALTKELDKLENTEIPIRILHRAVGGISESDVQLADASQAIIIGFRVAPEDRAMSLADDKKIDIRRYDIIYQVTDEVKKAIEGMLVPEIKETHLGRAAVRQVFKISKVGTVAGCFVTQGTIERSAKIRLLRDGREIYKGSLEALKRFKDDVKEVREGFECGIRVSNYDDLKTDDIIEAYKIEEIRRTL